MPPRGKRTFLTNVMGGLEDVRITGQTVWPDGEDRAFNLIEPIAMKAQLVAADRE